MKAPTRFFNGTAAERTALLEVANLNATTPYAPRVFFETDTGFMYIDIDGTAWIQVGGAGGGGSALTVREEDSSPSDTAVTVIRVPNGTLVQNSAGNVSLLYETYGAVATHVADLDPHTQYATVTDLSLHAHTGGADGALLYDATLPSAIGTAAAGTSTKYPKVDHVHPTGAGTPTTIAAGDAAVIGAGPAAAMTNHKHGAPATWPASAATAGHDFHEETGAALTRRSELHVMGQGLYVQDNSSRTELIAGTIYDAIVDDLDTNAVDKGSTRVGKVYSTLALAVAAGAVTILYRHSSDSGTVTIENTDAVTRIIGTDPNTTFPAHLTFKKQLGLIEYLRFDTKTLEMQGDQSVAFGCVFTGTGNITITGNDVLVVSPHVIACTNTPVLIDATASVATATAHRPRITAGAFLANSGPNVIRIVCAGTNLATQRPNSGAIVGCVFNGNVPSTSATVYTGMGYTINFVRPDAATQANETSPTFGGVWQWDIAGNIFSGVTTGVMLIRGTDFNISGNVIAGDSVVTTDTSVTHYGDSTGTEQDAHLLFGNTTGNARRSQGVKFPGAYTINKVKLFLKKIGAPVDNLTVDIYSDNGSGLPNLLLASSDVIVGSTLSTSYGYITFTVSTAASGEVASGRTCQGGFYRKEETQYHIVVRRSGAADAVNHYAWGCDQSSPAYPDGRDGVFDSVAATWSAPVTAADALFDCLTSYAQTGVRFRTPSCAVRLINAVVSGNIFGELRVIGWTDLHTTTANVMNVCLYTGNIFTATSTTQSLFLSDEHMVGLNLCKNGNGGFIHIDWQSNNNRKGSFVCNLEAGTSGCAIDNIGSAGIVALGNTQTGLYGDLVPAVDNSLSLGSSTKRFVNIWFIPSAQQSIAVNAAIVANARQVEVSTTTAANMTAQPTIADGVDGQELLITNTGANTFTLQDQSIIASNLRLSAAGIALGTRDSIWLRYSAAIGDWVQIGQSNVI